MTRLFDLLQHQLEQHPQTACVSVREESGNWKSYSTQEIADMAETAAAGLLKMGLSPGDKVALVSYKNRPEWLIMDFAIQMAGMVSIPLYPTISIREYTYILNEAEVRAAFCGGLDLYDKLDSARKEVPTLTHIYTFDRQEGRPYWEDIFDASRKEEVAEIKKGIGPEDLVTIIYTSGTTGNPKGVMLTHGNIMHGRTSTGDLMDTQPGERVLSFLPMCHIYERAVTFMYIYKGASIYHCGTDNLPGPAGDLASVQPVGFTSVPRLLEKIYEAIFNKGLALKGVKKKLFFWALGLADNYDPQAKRTFADHLKWGLADRLVFSKWRAALGGNIRVVYTGSAPCPVKILRAFCAAGIQLREGYGLTETSPVLTFNRLETDGVLLGTVGPTVSGVELYIDETAGDYGPGEGEILARGPNIMQGYYKKQEINDQVFVELDGKRWFRTGDIGKMVPGPGGLEYLKITDRKKELLKTSGGKYVAPAPIENRFREDFLVEQIMVVGDKQKFVSALIVPAEEALKNWCRKKNIPWTSLQEMICEERVIARYQKLIDRYNPEFSHIEQIKKFRLVPNQWLPLYEDGSEAELTPTLKLKRRSIRKKYAREIAEIYA
ncbi:long-chain fatty acid--CoA ligase [Robiginitalea sp. SC105]|uniref:AMP-dependent synthetase/ligase n=1 Tax=Robiginitalea sp. SC105 TaxID=2762332 RepID=UPI00163A6795|nr:long-chain fatty acid--CoA ligase [Robiginitalea sp. SC105]MBC2838134.1 long-chain fatty acid--CoA ligase [Robiginitalea sp. SC105]